MTPSTTFAECLRQHAQERAEAVAVIENQDAITWHALHARVQALAAGLHRIGVMPGDRVALWLPNGIAWVTSFLACAHLGTTVIAVNTRFRATELGDLLERGRASWLIVWPDFKGIAFGDILSDVPEHALRTLKGCVLLGGQARLAAPSLSALPCHAFDVLASEPATPPHPAPNSGVLCFTTSGTTSKPKLVLHDQATLIRHGVHVARAFAYDDHACVLASAPFCGAFGFATFVSAFATGAPVVCDPVFDAQRSVDAVRTHKVTHTYANNEALVNMLSVAQAGELQSAQLFGFASFAPTDALTPLAEQHGVPLTGLYGSSELIALVAGQPTREEDGDLSVRLRPGGKLAYAEARVRARDPASGSILAHGGVGEIEILTPSLMQGYLDDPAATAKAVTEDGYFKTGDLGYCLSDHQFVFETRMGDSLRLAGFLVNPAEIERVVQALPGVQACQVVGVTHQGKAVPYAFVVLQPGAQAAPDAWRNACRRNMAGFKVPVAFDVLDEFPTVVSANSVKIVKSRLREMADAALRSPAAQP